jgi:hypothetical protein
MLVGSAKAFTAGLMNRRGTCTCTKGVEGLPTSASACSTTLQNGGSQQVGQRAELVVWYSRPLLTEC